jgi:hypothetical protein
MELETVKALTAKYPQRSRWEYVNFVIEPYGEFQGRAILSQLRRLRDLDKLDADDQDVQHEIQQVGAWLSQFSQEEITQHLEGMENTESAYWSERLAREAAVDLLSVGKVSKAVMERAVLFDESAYRQFSQTCNTILQVITQVTREVETEMGMHPQLPEGEPQ